MRLTLHNESVIEEHTGIVQIQKWNILHCIFKLRNKLCLTVTWENCFGGPPGNTSKWFLDNASDVRFLSAGRSFSWKQTKQQNSYDLNHDNNIDSLTL